MCRMFGVLSLAYVAIFMITVVHSSEDRTSTGIVDFMGTGIVLLCYYLKVKTINFFLRFSSQNYNININRIIPILKTSLLLIL